MTRLRLPRLRWLRLLLRSKRACLGLGIIGFFVWLAIFGPLIWHASPQSLNFTALPEQPPSLHHWLGTDQQSHDVFLEMVDGARPTLVIGFSVAAIATALSIVMGTASGYLGGVVDDLLSLVTNVFLVLPTIPLMIALAAWLHVRSDLSIILVISLTSWAFGARVLRSQTLSLRERDFVALAIVRGEPSWRILFGEILPNMTSLVVSGFIGTTVFAIGTAAGLQFIGLGNLAETNWFTILYWAQNTSSLQTGAWWTFLPAGCAIALFGMGCTFVNYGIDQISNPRLQSAVRRKRLTPSLVVPGILAKQATP